MNNRLSLLLISLLFLWGCSPNSLEEFQEEGEATSHLLLLELQKIQTRNQLVASSPRLKKLFDNLVSTIIAAREYQHTHPEEEMCAITPRRHYLNDRLRAELNRIYETIDGGRDLIEECQFDALHTLDLYEHGKEIFSNYFLK